MDDNALAEARREAAKAADMLQAKSRHAEVLERQLRKLFERFDLASEASDVSTPLAPLGGVSMSVADAYRALAPAAAHHTGAAWWPTAEKPRPELTPNVGFASYGLRGAPLVTLGFIVLGLDRATLETTLERIESEQAEAKSFTPVFIYDGTDFDLFRARGYVLEWIPPAEDRERVGGTLPWDAYITERIAFLTRKWGLRSVISIDAPLLAEDETPLHEERPEAA